MLHASSCHQSCFGKQKEVLILFQVLYVNLRRMYYFKEADTPNSQQCFICDSLKSVGLLYSENNNAAGLICCFFPFMFPVSLQELLSGLLKSAGPASSSAFYYYCCWVHACMQLQGTGHEFSLFIVVIKNYCKCKLLFKDGRLSEWSFWSCSGYD